MLMSNGTRVQQQHHNKCPKSPTEIWNWNWARKKTLELCGEYTQIPNMAVSKKMQVIETTGLMDPSHKTSKARIR